MRLAHPLTRIVTGLLLATACWSASFDEEFAAKIGEIDKSSADAMFDLGNWCLSKNRPIKAREQWNAAIRLDKDHEGARTALGYVRQGEKWVIAASGLGSVPAPRPADGAGASPSEGPVPTPRAAGPGPAAKDIAWALILPPDPDPANTWLNDTFIDRISGVKNGSDLMARAEATIAQKYLALGIHRLCVALTKKDFTDLYLASSLVMRSKSAHKLLPFLMKASETATDPGDLEAFAQAVGVVRDKRSLPRMIELLSHSSKDVVREARSALAAITQLPEKELTAEKAKTWWDTFHATPDRDIWLIYLRNPDLKVQMDAANSLYELREPAIMRAIIRALRSDDRIAVNKAIALLERIAGSSDIRPGGSAADRKKQVDLLEKFWNEDGGRFTWAEDRKATPAEATTMKDDPASEMIQRLESTTGSDAANAESAIKELGKKAIPALITALDSPSPLIRLRAIGILRGVSKQSLAYDANAVDRAAAVAAWKKWAIANGHITDGSDASGAPGGTEVAEAPETPSATHAENSPKAPVKK